MNESSVTQRLIGADFLTQSYRLVGKVQVTNTGLMGMLNDPNTSFMEVLDVKLARLHMPTKLVEHYDVIRLVKASVFAMCVTRREDLGPQALTRGGYERTAEYPVRVTTPVYELDGTLEWAGRFDFSAIMVEGSRDFVPLYNAALTAILMPALKIESPALLFNRRHVDLLGLKTHRKQI
jgi:hypothetical protein